MNERTVCGSYALASHVKRAARWQLTERQRVGTRRRASAAAVHLRLPVVQQAVGARPAHRTRENGVNSGNSARHVARHRFAVREKWRTIAVVLAIKNAARRRILGSVTSEHTRARETATATTHRGVPLKSTEPGLLTRKKAQKPTLGSESNTTE